MFDFLAAHRVRLRTTNGLERINRELRRRKRVASIFTNPDSCLRLVSALLAELDDEWMIGYLNLNPSVMITNPEIYRIDGADRGDAAQKIEQKIEQFFALSR